MRFFLKKFPNVFSLLLVTALLLPANQIFFVTASAKSASMTQMTAAQSTEQVSAATLRVTLNQLLGEHVLLAASATNNALDGRKAGFKAAATALDANSVDLAAAVGSVYGQAAGDAFLPLWRTHIGFFVDYTMAVAADDEDKRTQALDDLTQYAQDFGAFLESANPNLTQSVVAEALAPHVATLTAVIDAQAAGDPEAAFTALREAYAHMSMIGTVLAGAIGQQFPEQFPGAVDSPATDLQAGLNALLAEHTYLAALAASAAIGDRQAEFEAAAAALDTNSVDLAAAITSVYGQAAGDAFLPLWRTHIGFFVDYTLAVAADDEDKRTQALADLTQYAQDFGAFLESANPNLTQDAVAGLLGPHVTTLTAVIDDLAAGDPVATYTDLRAAYAHMRMVADPLAAAITAQFPENFGDAAEDDGMAGHSMNHSASNTVTDTMTSTVTSDTEPIMTTGALRSVLRNLLGEHTLLAASATDAALLGRTAEFEAAAAALDENSVDIAKAIGSVYGDEAADAFLPLWRSHIGFFVDYVTGFAEGKPGKQRKALNDLDQYALDFGAFLQSANPNLPQEAVAEQLRAHVATLIAVIDAQIEVTPQASGNQQSAYTALREAYAHMDMTAAALAGGISAQFPDLFPGQVDTAAADLRAALNGLLAEHTYLVAKSSAAALAARNVEFEAAAGTLDQNSQDIAAAISSIYGEEAGAAFLPLWRKHIGFFIGYTLALVEKDTKTQKKVLADLTNYATDFGAFLSSANPNLPADAVASLVAMHAETTIAIIDAAADDDPVAFYAALRTAYAHMPMIADPLADAIIAQFPDQFAEAMVMEEGMTEEPAAEESMAEGAAPVADLRVTLNQLLGEHVLLAASATNNALGGRKAGFEAAAVALDTNSVDLAAAVGSVYGQAAGDAFLPLWRTHIGFFVDYTMAAAADDEDKRTQALDDLTQYAQDFGAFLESANPNLPQSAVAEAIAPHVATLTAVIDAQAAGDPEAAFTALRKAYAHMSMIGTVLAGAIGQQFPEQFPGAIDSPAADLQAGLNALLAEHTYLAALAASAAIGDRQAEFEAAAAALDTNSIDLAAAITSVYGQAAGDAFLPLWRTHIGFFVDYITAAATDDADGRDQALADLTQYAQDFGAFLESANPNLTQDAVAGLLGPHVTTLTAVIGDLAAGDPEATYTDLRAAYAHMRMVADPLAAAITAQFPDQFGDAMMEEEMTDEAAVDSTDVMTDTGMVDTPVETVVLINTFAFKPSRLEIPVGTTVVWQNEDQIDHTVTAGAPDAKSNVFASELFNQGEEFTFTFTEAGEFSYFCQRHPSMRGMVVVTPAP